MNILVFCSAQDVAEKYTNDAAELARLIAIHGHTLVWGGSDTGTMKVIADSAQAAGGKIKGVSMEYFARFARKNADEMIFAKDVSERKKLMLEHADAVVALAGGLGTMDEVSEVLALKRQKVHSKPVTFLNTDNYYEGFKLQFERMKADGFMANKDRDLETENIYFFADTPQAAIDYIEQGVVKSTAA